MLAESIQTLAIGALVATVVYVTSIVLRNKRAYQFFKTHSPGLPVVPNPGWFGGHSLLLFCGGRNWINISKFHKEFGPNFGAFMRDKPMICTTDLELIKRIVIDEPSKHPNRMMINCLSDELEIDCIVMAKDDQWQRLRNNIAPAFSSHKIKSANVQAEINSTIDKFVASIGRRLDKQADSDGSIEIEAEDLTTRYSLALVYTMFYKQDNLIDFDVEVEKNVVETSESVASLANPLLSLSVFFPVLRPVMLWLVNNVHPQARFRTKLLDFIKSQTKLHQRAQQFIAEAKLSGRKIDEDQMVLAGGEKYRRNMIDYIADQFRSGKLTKREYFHSSFQLFFAASKTTADALAKTFYLLASHQSVQDKLRKVIGAEGGQGEYVGWVLFEVMRLYPPTLIGCTRTISSDEYTSDGHLVPTGTIVITCSQTIHLLKEYWGEDAEEFKPERWANSKQFHPCQYLAFGAGKRICPGKELAIYEMRELLAQLLSRFKFEPSSKSTGYLSYQSPLLFAVVPDKPTYVKISRLSA